MIREKRMDRFEETRDLPWRPDLTQKVADYDVALVHQIDEELRERALEALRETTETKQSARVQLDCAASALGLEVTWSEMDTISGVPKKVVELMPTQPPIVCSGEDEEAAAAHMVEHLRIMLPSPVSEAGQTTETIWT